eukprot:4006400-Prymnesium_polylepis.1
MKEIAYSNDPNHPEIAVTWHELGLVRYDLGQLEDAAASFERALGMKQTNYGMSDPDNPEVLATRSELEAVRQQLAQRGA